MKEKGRQLHLGFKSIKMTMLVSFAALIAAAVLVLAFISVQQIEKALFETSTDYTMQLVTMVNSDIDSYISNMENLAELVLNNSNVGSYLYGENGRLARDENAAAIGEQFELLRDTRDDIYNIGIVGKNGRYFINREDVSINPYAKFEGMDWYTKAISGKGEITSSHVQNIVLNEYKWVVTLSRGILNPKTERPEGVLFIDLNYSSISSLCETISLGAKGYVFILDENGSVIFHPKQQLLYNGLLDERIDKILSTPKGGNGNFLSEDGKRLYTVTKSEKTGWSVVGVTYLDELLSRSEEIQKLYIVLAVCLIAVATVISMILSAAITKPITKLRSTMKQVEQGNLETQMQFPRAGNEIRDLIASFNVMVGQIKELIQKNKEEQDEKRKSEFKALQAQINPHFLYNTLDSIIWMAESAKNKEVISMTSALSKLLRKSISNQKEIVIVAEEIEYVSEYLKIQQMRYHDKLEYEINVEDEVMHCSIAKLVLQPLVENAIYHGIKSKEGKGRITITGSIEGEEAILRIHDNGIGMDANTLAHIFDGNKGDSISKVGVRNVNSRLKLYYGEGYGLSYNSSVGHGTYVTVMVPYEERQTGGGHEEDGKE